MKHFSIVTKHQADFSKMLKYLCKRPCHSMLHHLHLFIIIEGMKAEGYTDYYLAFPLPQVHFTVPDAQICDKKRVSIPCMLHYLLGPHSDFIYSLFALIQFQQHQHYFFPPFQLNIKVSEFSTSSLTKEYFNPTFLLEVTSLEHDY